MRLRAFVLLASASAPACYSPVPRRDWPDPDLPQAEHAVWLEVSAHLCSGTIVHSSPERGTYVLTAAHCVQKEFGIAEPAERIEVGVFALSHVDPIEEGWILYPADVVAVSGEPPARERDSTWQTLQQFLGALRAMSGEDLAVLRLRTDRLFRAAVLHEAGPADLEGREAVVVAVAPEMYPHAKPARCRASDLDCPTGTNGNSGAGAYVDGKIVGIYNVQTGLSVGPEDLRRFLGASEATRFLATGETGP